MSTRSIKPRERALITIAIGVFVAILLVPKAQQFADEYRAAQLQANAAVDRLEQARQLREFVLEERANQKAITDRIADRGQAFDLYTFTNASLAKHKLQEIVTLRSESSRYAASDLDVVRIELQGVNMDQLLDFLHAVYASDNLVTLRILYHLRPRRNGKGLDCSLSLMAPKAYSPR